MVYYFTAKTSNDNDDISDMVSTISTSHTIYMGKDKFENDPLIKHSHPKNIWFHVDNHSSAHLYLQLTHSQIMNWKSFGEFTIEEDLLTQLAQLTKANSIKANKLNNITIIYTPVENLHTDGSMDTGTVTFKNPKLVKRVKVAKRENAIINKLVKTKTEASTEEFIKAQEELVKEIAKQRKIEEAKEKELSLQYAQSKQRKADPYADLFNTEELENSSNDRRPENWDEDDFCPKGTVTETNQKSKPINRDPTTKSNHIRVKDPELAKVIINQLCILLTTVDSSSVDSHYRQIRFIFKKQVKDPIVLNNYFEKLFGFIRFSDFNDTKSSLSPIESLFKKELDFIASELKFYDLFCVHLDSIIPKEFNIVNFTTKFDCDPILTFLLTIRYHDKNSQEIKAYFEKCPSSLLSILKTRNFPKDYSWSVLLEHILNKPYFPFLSKLITLSSIKAFDSDLPQITKFYQNILKMSFKSLLHEVGFENVVPEKLLPSLLQIKPQEVDQGIALVLAEILIPGSQGFRYNNAPLSLPEANAKGAQLQASFKAIEQSDNLHVNWYEVFNYMQQYLFESSQRNAQPSVASVSQFLSSLDFKQDPIDIFLNYEWWFDKILLYILQTCDASQGGYDIALSRNLSLCFEEDREGFGQQQMRRNILKFINVGKLELQVITKVQAQQMQQNLSDQDRELNAYLTQVFERDYRVFPEYVLATALSVIEKTPFVNDLIDTSFYLLMDNDSPAVPKVVHTLQELGLASGKVIDYYKSRNTFSAAEKTIAVSLKLNILDQVLQQLWNIDVKLAVRLLIELSVFNYDYAKDLESKLNDQQLKSSVYQSLLDVVSERVQMDNEAFQQHQRQQQQPDQLQIQPKPLPMLKLETSYYLLEKLKSANGLIDLEKLKNLQILLLTTYPRLINFGNGHDDAILANEAKSSFFPLEVELEMKDYYSKMYSKAVDIPEIVNVLIKMKSSDDPHQQDVFACMIHSLLDEYKFFGEYPLPALASTSLLFGALLENDLIQGTTLTVTLNYIWESCNQAPDSNMFKFAVQALYNFKSKLHEYPIYCKHLLECRSLPMHAKMYKIVKDAANGIPCTVSGSKGERTSSTTPDVGPKYQSIDYVEQTIGSAKQEDPPEEIRDKLLFSVNNMTPENLRVTEISAVLKEEYFAWFADYLVADRAKAEPNNHGLYSSLVKALDNAMFKEYVMNITMKEVSHLVRNSKDSRTDRNKLKNLGAWLGRITLAEDKPLRRDLIAIKFLLVEAYDFDSLSLILPFVCKILSQIENSKVFKPPNPWVLGIFQVLSELYQFADLVLQLKFEVEVLLKLFDMKIEDIEPSELIRKHDKDPGKLAAMFGLKPQAGDNLALEMSRMNLEQSQMAANFGASQLPSQSFDKPFQQVLPGQPLLPQQQQQPQQINTMQSYPQQPQQESGLDTSFSTLVGNTIFTQNANLRRALQASLTRAVRECAEPILNRVSEAVLVTTEFLIKKDFATEKDISKIRRSYHRMAQQLSHSMVLCSGKKMLLDTIEATMLHLLSSSNSEIPIMELNSAIQSNVGLCVDIVDKIAATNVTDLIDERMKPYLLKRERHAGEELYVEEGTPEYSLRLPEPLGLNRKGLNVQQLSIYEHFGELRNDSLDGLRAAGLTPSGAPAILAHPQPQQHPQQQQQPQLQAQPQMQPPQLGQDFPQQPSSLVQEDIMPLEQLFTAITRYCEKAVQLVSEVSENKLSNLPPNHPIMTTLTQALAIAQSNALKYPDLLLRAAQYAVNCLFTQVHNNPMSNEIYVVILDKLCEFSPSTAKDVIWWLVNSSDQRKFNMPVILSLLKVQLISPIKFDESISKLIKESHNPEIVKFGASLLLNVFTAEEPVRPIALRSEFAKTLDALYEYKKLSLSSEEDKQAQAEVEKLFEVLRTTKPATSELYAQLGYVFTEWVRLLTHGAQDTRVAQEKFVAGLVESGILNNADYFKTFWKAAVDISTLVFTTEQELRSRTQHEAYLSIDCVAILITRVVLNVEDEQQAIHYLKKIIAVIELNLVTDHENKSAWNDRPYFRFFSSLLSAWNDASVLNQAATKKLDTEFYLFLGDVFNTLQPIVLPGFTFSWIALISHRMFLPQLLELPDRAGYGVGVKLLTSLLKFQQTYQNKDSNRDVLNVVFKGINRIFVGLIHDYPEFLVECHYQLVTAIPRTYIQLKNIVLSATPKDIIVPDPFTQGLKVERLPEINVAPVVYYKPIEDLAKVGLKKPVENFLRIPAPGLMRTIYNGLKLNQPKTTDEFGYSETITFNAKLINALVLHVGMNAVAEKSATNRGFNTKTSQVALLVDLMNFGSNEFRYIMLNSIANQLRYPNSHTHWFIGIILHFFSSNSIWNSSTSTKLTVQEIITRVLLERRIVNKPHPWGLTILFTELVKNESYGLFELPFVKNSIEEIKTIFDTLSTNVKG
ncbi:CDC39 [Candida metapsilosis]|uniref:CDC39 n=1 Tax=Candida metapsilosis TaxID=273372 RepID=A0A8H8DBM6_9ASCO|nr:CDC39 [Candida metapsilosis]